MELTEENKKHIDAMSYREMLSEWRKQEQDDRDPSQELSENERAEYGAWSEWVAAQMKKEEANVRS